MTHEDRIYRTLNDHLEKMVDVGGMYENNDWFCIYATGSMNYGLFDDASDVDTKLLLFPNLSQVSGVTSMPTVEHHIGDEHCTACDVREFLRIAICKTNPNYMEFFTTDYYIVNPVYEKELRELRACGDAIVRGNVGGFEKSCLGMAFSMLKIL